MSLDPLNRLFGGKTAEPPAATPQAQHAPPGPAARAAEDDAEPQGYRPYVIRGPRPAFSVVEAAGKRHGFGYHHLRHPVHETQEGQEFLSFECDGCAVVMQGAHLLPLYHGMLRHTLWEVREHDGRQARAEPDNPTVITRLEVTEPQERAAQMRGQGARP